MSASKDVPAVYAASINPPRRAKRQRTGSLGDRENPSAPSPQQRRAVVTRPPILPKPSPTNDRDYVMPASPDSELGSDEEDDYEPGRDPAPVQKRRGRKPGTMSRSARESLRKLNHSRIEKARRTKINETLSTLSTLVSDRGRVLSMEKMEVSTVTEEEKSKSKGKAEEKEFKLDVLVKTVEYMQDLIARVQELEAKLCAQCRVHDDAESTPRSPKRKRPEETVREVEVEQVPRRPRHSREEEDSYIGDDEHGLAAAEDEQPSPMPFTASPAPSASRSTASPRLPPIASWLPHPYVDPSSFMPSSNAAPSHSPANAQLPSPPSSGRFRPAITLANMPTLTLPAPVHPLAPASTKKAAGQNMPPPRQHRKSVSSSPTVSPTWTPEDETAASLLLQMSSKPRSSSISSSTASTPPAAAALPRALQPITPMIEDIDVPMARASLEVVTPGSLLGMRD